MFDRVLRRFRDLVQAGRYLMTVHAVDEMEDDRFTVFDVESCVLTGRIIERQRDARTSEWKYRIRGESLAGDACEVIGKLTPTNKVAILTVYALKG